LDYLLHDNPAADVGAYGFFARLTSPAYAASAPFLVILNDDIDPGEFPGQLMTAALCDQLTPPCWQATTTTTTW